MIDTHAHLTSEEFAPDLSETLSRARAAGVHSILCVSETLSDAHAALAISAKHPSTVHAALGLHPAHVTTQTPAELAASLSAVTTLLSTAPAAAIGEVGLDHTPRVLSSAPSADLDAAKQAQADTFAHFLALSQRLQLPITAHSRGAGRRALELVRAAAVQGPVAVAMHAFDGRAVHAERALAAVPHGLYFSVPPSIVRSPQLSKLVRRLPVERLLLESDAPVLGPSVGERNEPMHVVKAAEMIAAVKGLDPAAVRENILENTVRMFPKLAHQGNG